MTGYYHEGNTLVLSERSEIILEKRTVSCDVALHRHGFIEIAYVESGEGVHEIADGHVSRIKKGDLVLFNTGVAHGYKVSPPDSLVIYNCLFDPSVLDGSVTVSDDFIHIVYSYLFESATKQGAYEKPYLILSNAGSAAGIMKEMLKEYTEKENGYSKINAANLTRLLVTIFRLKRAASEGSSAAYKAAVAESAARYINEYFPEKISCETLAARAFVSTGYFHKVFREVTGKTPVEYIQSVRLNEAARLLGDPSLTVRDAADRVGYSDLKYFYQIFKREFGQTPGEYKKSRVSGR